MDLINAIKEGRKDDAIAIIVKSNPEDLIFSEDFSIKSTLIISIDEGYLDIAQLLIDKMRPEDLSIRDRSDRTALILAISKGYIGITKLLIDKMRPEDLRLRDKKKHSALMKAIYKKHLEIAKLLIEKMRPDDLSLQDKKGETALLLAINKNKSEIIKPLIEKMKQDDLALQDKDGENALLVAINKNKLEIAQLLIAKMRPEDLASQNEKGDNALLLMLNKNQLEIAKLLIEKMSPEDLALDKYGMTALMYAVKNDMLEIVTLLIDKMRPEGLALQGSNNDTALTLAVSKRQIDVIKQLIEKMNSENLAIQNHEGENALLLAIQNDMPDIARLLIEKIKPEDLSLEDIYDMTALAYATQNNMEEITVLLIEKMRPEDLASQGSIGDIALPSLLDNLPKLREDFYEITINKDKLWDSLRRALAKYNINNARKLKVKFVDDIGVDEGGVVRDMYARVKDDLLTHDLITPDDNYFTFHFERKDVLDMTTLGKLIAMSIAIDQIPLSIKFNPIILYFMIYYLVNPELEIGDVTKVDYENISNILKKYDYEKFGRNKNIRKLDKLQEITDEKQWEEEGKFEGLDEFYMSVIRTDIFANKDQFIMRMFIESLVPYFDNLKLFLSGFLNMVERRTLKNNIEYYTIYWQRRGLKDTDVYVKLLKDLNLLIEGITELSYDDFKDEVTKWTEIKNDIEKEIFNRFWGIVKENATKDKDYLNNLLRFWTSYPSLPSGGFNDRIFKENPIHITFKSGLQSKVVAHTCFNDLEILYTTSDETIEYLKNYILPNQALIENSRVGFCVAGGGGWGGRATNSQYYHKYMDYKNKYIQLKEKLQMM